MIQKVKRRIQPIPPIENTIEIMLAEIMLFMNLSRSPFLQSFSSMLGLKSKPKIIVITKLYKRTTTVQFFHTRPDRVPGMPLINVKTETAKKMREIPRQKKK